jgi:UDP-N-acetylmuramate--alanine ligase
MRSSVDLNGRPFHFIGIGGIGMSALAHILLQRRLPVSGSDLKASPITQQLKDLGAHVFQKQQAKNLKFFSSLRLPTASQSQTSVAAVHPAAETALLEKLSPQAAGSHADAMTLPQVICSTAIPADNPEYQAALDLGCPIFHRSDLLAALMREYQGIAVAGTHGKTTTSSLISYLLLKADLDPTIIVGGQVKAWGGNARMGEGPYLVAEADESDGSLVKFAADIGVITNIELDHPDHYQSLEEVVQIFQTFAGNCRTLIVSLDCPVIRERFIQGSSPSSSVLSYSLDPDSGADYTVQAVQYHAAGTTAEVWERGQPLGILNLKLLGSHNLSNALAAVAVGRLVGLEFSVIARSVVDFEGAQRRFELRGECNGIRFIDDYAHHPSEILVTLNAARLQVDQSLAQGGPWKRVVAVFQPHRYSRALAFLSEFSQAFGDADRLVVTDIYSAGEPDQGLITSSQMVSAIAQYHTNLYYRPTLPAVAEYLTQSLEPGDLVLFLGAGNLNQIIPDVMAFDRAGEAHDVQKAVAS